jgi:hypothetical protein
MSRHGHPGLALSVAATETRRNFPGEQLMLRFLTGALR